MTTICSNIPLMRRSICLFISSPIKPNKCLPDFQNVNPHFYPEILTEIIYTLLMSSNSRHISNRILIGNCEKQSDVSNKIGNWENQSEASNRNIHWFLFLFTSNNTSTPGDQYNYGPFLYCFLLYRSNSFFSSKNMYYAEIFIDIHRPES